MPPIAPRELLEQARAELVSLERAILAHPYLDELEAGRAPRASLQALVCEQRPIIASDRRSFAQLAARFPTDPAGSFFLTLAEGEGIALGLLGDLAAALGLDEERLTAYEPRPGCQAYPAFVAWLALNGSRADVALALLANLAAWGANCARADRALRARYGLDERAVAFLSFFASPPPELQERALAVIEAGLREGDDSALALRATRLLQAYEMQFWDTLAAAA